MLPALLSIVALLMPASNYQRPVTLSSSNILEELAQRKKSQPAITSKELAAVGNELLEKRGFDYRFDVCDILSKGRNSTATTVNYDLSLTNGQKRRFRFAVTGGEEGLCGECWAALPSLQVTQKEMILIAEDKRYHVRRTALFSLDEVELVDATMKRVSRTWQLPYQTIPIGISSDGRKLYIDFYTQFELDGLVLELSENGGLVFRDRSEAKMVKGEFIEDHPKDPNNAYLSFIRFDAGDKTYIIRFSAPCT